MPDQGETAKLLTSEEIAQMRRMLTPTSSAWPQLIGYEQAERFVVTLEAQQRGIERAAGVILGLLDNIPEGEASEGNRCDVWLWLLQYAPEAAKEVEHLKEKA